MATPPAEQFSHSERIDMLAGILKRHPPQDLNNFYNTVIGFVPQSPNFYEIVPPPGRTAQQTRNAFEQLRHQQPSMQRGSYGRHSSSSSLPGMHQHSSLKRPFESQYPNIAPRPPHGIASGGGGYRSQLSPIEQPPKKKRGRPKKEDNMAQAETSTASSGLPNLAIRPESSVRSVFATSPSISTFPAPSNVQAPEPRVSAFAPQPTPLPLPRSNMPSSSGMAISSLLTPTAQMTTSASQSSSSSGRRRRGRSTRSEPEDVSISEAARTEEQETQFESPNIGTAPGSFQDSPARAAVLRHREEHQPEQQAAESATREHGATTTPPMKHEGPDP